MYDFDELGDAELISHEQHLAGSMYRWLFEAGYGGSDSDWVSIPWNKPPLLTDQRFWLLRRFRATRDTLEKRGLIIARITGAMTLRGRRYTEDCLPYLWAGLNILQKEFSA